MSEPVVILDRETYLRERSFALEVAREQTKFIDQTVLTLSGGALGLSLTFLDKIGQPTVSAGKILLFCAWTSLILSIVAVLSGMHASQWALDRHINNLDTAAATQPSAPFKFNNPFAKCTSVLNYMAFLLFAVGILTLSAFAYVNFRP